MVTVFPPLFEIYSKEDVQEKEEERRKFSVENILSGCGCCCSRKWRVGSTLRPCRHAHPVALIAPF
jgi:hypothetical protein